MIVVTYEGKRRGERDGTGGRFLGIAGKLLFLDPEYGYKGGCLIIIH